MVYLIKANNISILKKLEHRVLGCGSKYVLPENRGIVSDGKFVCTSALMVQTDVKFFIHHKLFLGQRYKINPAMSLNHSAWKIDSDQ